MNIESLRKLRKPVWYYPNRDKYPDMAFRLVPAEAGTVLGGQDPAVENERIARRAFIDLRFPGTDGKPTENTKENRLLVLSSWELRTAIVGELIRLNSEITEGEPVAASGSPDGE